MKDLILLIPLIIMPIVAGLQYYRAERWRKLAEERGAELERIHAEVENYAQTLAAYQARFDEWSKTR